MRLLLVEDEHRLSEVLKKGLVEEGFAVDQAFDGEDGLHLAQTESYDVIILDVMLPKIDGIQVCKNLRNKNSQVPILMLTARTQLEDKLTGLDAGADDYLTKPFAFLELKSRIYALLRRSHQQSINSLKIDNLELDPTKHLAKRGTKEIKLTPKEFSILEYLMRHKDEVVTRTQITEHVWDYNFDSMSNIVDVFMATLRKKIDFQNQKKLIYTIHSVGYKISDAHNEG